MKVLQISIEVNSGSVGRIAEQIGEEVLKIGGESYITYARNNLPSKSKTIKIGNKIDIYIHGIRTRLFDEHCYGSKKATKKLINQIRTINPSIILIHHIHGYYLNMRTLFEYLSSVKIPIVWIFHDCWSFTGHCAHFEEIGCDRWKLECYSCPLKTSYPASFVFDRSTKNYNEKKALFNSIDNLTIVAVSNWISTLVKQSFLSSFGVKVIYNGVNTDIFKPSNRVLETKKKYGLKNEFIVLGLSSVWNKSKGLDDFISLSKMLDLNVKIILVGLTNKQIDNLPKNIIGINRTENINELVDLYSLSDLFLNLTYNDTFPTTNIEALACGTPVLTYNTGGSSEAINEQTGFVVNKKDLDSVVKIINNVKALGKDFYTSNCRDRAIKYFNKNDRFKQYIDLFTNLINK